MIMFHIDISLREKKWMRRIIKCVRIKEVFRDCYTVSGENYLSICRDTQVHLLDIIIDLK